MGAATDDALTTTLDELDAAAAEVLRETNTTWELIAELSKGETTDVYMMILNHYDGKEGTAKSYLRYPAARLGELFDKLHTDTLLQKLGIPLPDSIVLPAGRSGGKKKGRHSKDKSAQGKGSAKGKGRKEKGKKGREKGIATVNKADQIREQQLVSRAVRNESDFAAASLRFDFSNNIVEVVLLYYLHITYNALQAKRVGDFLESIFSLRDAYMYFQNSTYGVDEAVASIVRAFIAAVQRRFPWKSFLTHHTRFLIKNHFRMHFQRALKPFPEQAALLDSIREEPHTLYTLPWGVGAGKTALIAPLSYIYNRMGYQMLYCVPFGPVRDQSAALLYRCGIPFAYVTQIHGGAQYELQPSYHCGNETLPTVLIVDPTFVKYYIEYWDNYRVLVGGDETCLDPMENSPKVKIPSEKRRYRHLSHAMWNPRFALVLDEPSENHPQLMWVLSQLPETTFVMSATSCNLVDSMVKERFRQRYEKEPRTIAATTIGVSTTLVARWLEGAPILTPFSGIGTRTQFDFKYRFIRDNILWRRFLSPEVLCDWYTRAVRARPELADALHITFDLMTLGFDDISERVLQWCDAMVRDERLDDAFFAAFCAFPTSKERLPADILREAFSTEAHTLMGGAVVGVPSVSRLYRDVADVLDDFPAVADVERRTRENNIRVREMYEAVNKMVIVKEDDRHRKEDRKREIEQQRLSQLPIDEHLILNTPEHVAQHTNPRTLHGSPTFARVQELLEDGDPNEDLRAWKIYPDVIPRVDEAYLRWRWKGVGSIVDNKEFNMKNMRDSDAGYLSFLAVDACGAYGLNLRIKHALLSEDARGRMLPVDTMMQVAGRVGRWGQDACGAVHLMSRRLFDTMFA